MIRREVGLLMTTMTTQVAAAVHPMTTMITIIPAVAHRTMTTTPEKVAGHQTTTNVGHLTTSAEKRVSLGS